MPLEPLREGGGRIDLTRADHPFVFSSPTSISFGLRRPGAAVTRTLDLTDAGGGAGQWSSKRSRRSRRSATLSLWLNIATNETTTTNAYDKLYVQIRNQNGAVLKTLATYSNLDETTDYVQKTFDVSTYKGQTVQVYFKMVEDNGKATSFRLDDITLTTQ